MAAGNAVSAGYECKASLLFTQRYNSMNSEAIFYQFFFKPAALLALAKVTGNRRAVQGTKTHEEELHKSKKGRGRQTVKSECSSQKNKEDL